MSPNTSVNPRAKTSSISYFSSGFKQPDVVRPSSSKLIRGSISSTSSFPAGNTDAQVRGTICAKSSKFHLLVQFLQSLRSRCPQDKVVIISNFTSVLTHVAAMAKDYRWDQLTLTGKTRPEDRQCLVDRFNRKSDTTFLFLLSSKAGGAGLNLTGANRLISLDPDWNPAVDKQAMARVWREGQTKPVFVYRFVVLNSIESAILSRQHTKGQVTGEIMHTARGFKPFSYTKKDLIQLSRPHIGCCAEEPAFLNGYADPCGDEVMAEIVQQQRLLPEPERQLLAIKESK